MAENHGFHGDATELTSQIKETTLQLVEGYRETIAVGSTETIRENNTTHDFQENIDVIKRL